MPSLVHRLGLTDWQAHVILSVDSRTYTAPVNNKTATSMVRKGLAVHQGCWRIRLTQTGVHHREVLMQHWKGTV